MHRVTEELAEASKKADFMINVINPAVRLINRLGQVLLAVFAGKMLLNGSLTVGVFQAFFQYVNQASEPLTEVAYMVNSMQSALASLERVYDLLDEEEISTDPAVPSTINEARGAVEFKNVRFGYTPDRILMKDINFSVKPGQKVAVVGSTGAGKTTLINLLMRFYELNGGAIFLDGVDTKEMNRSALRSNFGMVLQDTWLFGGTIADNIAYSRPEASRDEIAAAAKAARVDFFVRTMPHGYDTTEIEIGKAMKALMKNRTSFVIAHRLSTITDADLILFMRDGNIIEQGTHKTLLQKNGAYAELYYSQFA